MRSVKSRLLATAITVATIGTAFPASAQVGSPEGEAATLSNQADPTNTDGEVIVTGSRIRRTDLTSSAPISVIGQEEFQLQGAVNVEQVLNSLPQVLPGVTAFSNNPGNGASTLNLRNLGETRTLVLVNGRRWMFYDVAQIVDTNTIPVFMLQNTEVFTGGASAVYGTDAVAGVVNFNLRTNLNGFEGGVNYGITERGDARRYSADIAFGSNFADNRGNVTLYANYTRRSPVFQDARRYSSTAVSDACTVPGSADRNRSDIGLPSPTGVAVAGCVGRGGEVGLLNGGSANTPIASLAVGQNTFIFNPTGGGTRLFDNPGDLYNFNPDNYLQLPQERYLLGGYANYKITEGVEVYTELSFINNAVNQQLAPTPTGVAGTLQLASPFFNAQTRALLAPLDTGTGQDAVAGDGYVTTTVNFRFNQAGARNVQQQRQAFRVLGGLRGDITSKLRYDAYYLYSRTNNTQFQQGNISSSRYRAALNTEFGAGGVLQCRDAAARAAGCVPVNVFGSGLASQASLNYVRINSTNLETSELKNAVATLNGELFNLGLGAEDIGFSFGGEYREASARYTPDTFLASGDVLGFNAGQPTSGSFNVKEAFGEVRVPILRDNFIYGLELNGAARYSDYSLPSVGGNWTYTAGGNVSPIQGLTFRGQYARAVRAPNVGNLFSGQNTGFPAVIDPCSDRGAPASRTTALRNFCVANGVPAANVFTRGVQPNGQIQVNLGGNPNVREETSDTYTFGGVFSPTFIPRLNIQVDYFNIKVDNTIGVLAGGAASALSLCFNTIQDVSNAICAPFVGARSSQGALGESQGGRNPLFLSANVGRLETSGIDVQVDYNLPVGNLGRLSFNYLGTWLDRFRSIPISSIPERENILEGTFGSPKYRHTARLTAQSGQALLSLRWRFEGKTQNSLIQNTFNGTTRIGTDPATLFATRQGAYNVFDLTAGFDATEALNFNVGVTNLLDKQPPILGAASEQANTLPGFYEALGRAYFVSTRLRF